MSFCEALAGGSDPRGFVAFSAIRLWSQIRGIGFDQQPIEGYSRCDSADGIVFPVREHSAERQVESQLEAGSGCFVGTAERMHSTSELLTTCAILQDAYDVCLRLAAVDDERFFDIAGECDVASEVVLLDIKGDIFPVVIEPGFPYGDDLWMCGKLLNSFPLAGFDFVGMVRVHSDNRGDAGVTIGQQDHSMTGGQSNSDGQHPFDAGVQSALDDFIKILTKRIRFEVTMSIDQRSRHDDGESSGNQRG